jgi:DNA-binding LacI/PurR family transcriptional regulator
MATTIKEIAKRARVSIATVSRALNDDERVTEETKKLINSISNQLNYHPNILARNFVKKKSNIIGLILPEISDEYFTEIIQGIDEITFSFGYYTMVVSSHKNKTIVESISTLIGSGMIGGLMVLVPFFTEEIKNVLSKPHIPVIHICGDSSIKKFDTISIDDYQGSFDLTNYLICSKGYKKFSYISGPLNNIDAILRKKGFQDACRKNNINVEKKWIKEGDFTRQCGETLCREILQENKKPEIIVAANDMMAVGCYNVIKAHKLKIPADIAVTGFDDILLARCVEPGLTTVRANIEEVSKTAATMLMNKMKKQLKEEPQHIRIITELVIRKSC